MSNPARAPRDSASVPNAGLLMPDCHLAFVYAQPTEGQAKSEWERACDGAKLLEGVVEKLEGLDMVRAEPFVIPRDKTVDPDAFKSSRPYYALAKKGKVTFRLRTNHARDVLNTAFPLLPEELRDEVRQKANNLVLADGGAEFTIGRLLMAYPRKGASIAKPITPAEARRAWTEEVGTLLVNKEEFMTYTEPEERARLPFWGEAGERVVRMNLQAGNGFPVMGKGKDEEARVKVAELAQMVREEIESAHARDPDRGVWEWLREAERTRPWLVACQGKAKGDYYTGEKVQELKLRFYNALGRQMAINMQTATQVVEELAQSVLDSPDLRSSSGVALNGGGAAKLVAALDGQLRVSGRDAHTRMGDDSFVLYVTETQELIKFALDCSNFDLTQHADLTHNIHREVRRTVALVDGPASQLQYAYFRERLVVTIMRIVRRFKHAGPSGLPMQSKVNGAIMGVAIARAVDAMGELEKEGVELTEQAVGATLAAVGRGMGITIKLEQFSITPLRSTEAETNPLRYSLRRTPFLYLGYYFYNEDGIVAVHADMPRSMSQMRYPTLKWVEDKEDLLPLELGRLCSTVLGWGRPTKALRPAFDAIVADLDAKVTEALLKPGADRVDSRLRWAVQMSAQAGEEDAQQQASLAGVMRALKRGWDRNWLGDEETVSTASESSESEPEPFLPPNVVLAVPSPADGRLVPASRKPTKKTDGRNPNTKVFGPPKPPRNPMERMHENAAWVRTQGGAEDAADRWAMDQIELEARAAEERRRAEEEAEADFYGDETEEDRRGRLLDAQESEDYLDDGRWKI